MSDRRPTVGWIARVVVALAVLEGGWLAFDGGRALLVGDYITPASGEHAGQLGPWATIVVAAGIDPRSTLMKGLHVVLGTAFLVAAAGLARRAPWGRVAVLVCAVLGLWYAPFGTLLGIAQIVTLLSPAGARLSHRA